MLSNLKIFVFPLYLVHTTAINMLKMDGSAIFKPSVSMRQIFDVLKQLGFHVFFLVVINLTIKTMVVLHINIKENHTLFTTFQIKKKFFFRISENSDN